MTLFGRDTWCDASVRTGRYATGVRLVAQNAAHRLSTPRGQLRGGEDEENYGIDLPGMIGSIVTDGQAAGLPAQIQGELQKDPRILHCTAAITKSQTGPAVSWAIEIVVTTAEGNFTLAADAVTVQTVGLGGAT